MPAAASRLPAIPPTVGAHLRRSVEPDAEADRAGVGGGSRPCERRFGRVRRGEAGEPGSSHRGARGSSSEATGTSDLRCQVVIGRGSDTRNLSSPDLPGQSRLPVYRRLQLVRSRPECHVGWRCAGSVIWFRGTEHHQSWLPT